MPVLPTDADLERTTFEDVRQLFADTPAPHRDSADEMVGGRLTLTLLSVYVCISITVDIILEIPFFVTIRKILVVKSVAVEPQAALATAS